MLNVMIFEMRAERNSCARNITLDWIGVCVLQVLYQVTLRTMPNGALYEATVRHNRRTGRYQASSSEISRINRYASQPHCIAAQLPHLRPFCYCVNQRASAAAATATTLGMGMVIIMFNFVLGDRWLVGAKV